MNTHEANAAKAPKALRQTNPRGLIQIESVSKSYGTGRNTVKAVDDCTLTIDPGEICMIVGPSGCGKTTLLNAIAGFHSIDSGSIKLDGKLLCGPSVPKATPGHDRVVVFQNGALFPWKTNLENVAYGPLVQGVLGKQKALQKAREFMSDAGLSEYMDLYPESISSGARRRVEIVRALMNNPSVLLLDEPFRALDSLTKSLMHEALLDVYVKNKATIFFITHDLEEAVFLGKKVIIMTSRPCKPKKIIDVDIPYPRDYSILTSSHFRSIIDESAEAVHEEARKSFEAGEAEG